MAEEIENKTQENIKKEIKTKKIKTRTLLVIIVLAVFIIGSAIINRANYLETLEIGEEYGEVFLQTMKYKRNIAILNFIVVFCTVYITNGLIKKGLRKFFEEEKKEMPHLPNKSLALVFALLTSIIVSNMFLQKTILFVNASQFGISDPIFNMDVGFYMFNMPLIRTITILWSNTSYTFNNIYSRILYNSI